MTDVGPVCRRLAAPQRAAEEVLDADASQGETEAAAAAAVEESAAQRVAREAFLAAQRSAARADLQPVLSEGETPPSRPDTPLSAQYMSGAS
jgi:membrane protein involved in colicin uptake